MKWVLLLTAGVLIGVSFLPVEATQPTPFADPSFERVFNRTGNVAGVQALLWGGQPLETLVEPYTGAPGNRRVSPHSFIGISCPIQRRVLHRAA